MEKNFFLRSRKRKRVTKLGEDSASVVINDRRKKVACHRGTAITNFAYLILNIFQPSFDGSPRHKRSTHLRSQFHHDPPTDSQIVKQVESIIAYTLMYHYIVSNVLRKDRDLEVSKSLSVLNGRRIKVLHQIIIILDRKSPKQERCWNPVGRAKRTNAQKIFKNILAPLSFVVSLLHGT